MSNTYTKIYLHVVFSVKGWQKHIENNLKEPLHKYICGTTNNKKQKIYAIGGMPDHVHILISIKPDISISKIVGDIKANSSRWVNDNKLIPFNFQWQQGFGAFSVGYSQLETVITYINNQEQHHQKKTFKEEYVELLKRFDVEYDERYI